MAIFKWLTDYDKIITSYIIHDLRESDGMHYVHMEVHLSDSSKLFIREFRQSSRRKYAFHWQKNTGELILRWDNAPHFPGLPNFPHHKHLADSSVEDSYDISLDDILRVIASRIR